MFILLPAANKVKAAWIQFLVAALGYFLFSSTWLTNVDGMKDLWCSSTDQLLSTQI